MRFFLSAPELLDFIGRLRGTRQTAVPLMDAVLRDIAEYVAQEAKANTDTVRLNLAGGYTHGGSALRESIYVGASNPPTIYYGGGEPHAGGHEFGASVYRQFPVYNERGYIVGEVLDRDEHDAHAIFDPELIDQFLHQLFPL